MSIRSSDILQIDAIVITGVLILLTISADQFSNPSFQLGKGVSLLAWLIILPFSISAIYALKFELVSIENKIVDEQRQNKRLARSVIATISGFAYLVVFLGFYTGSVITAK